jgi:hypothetical protein
MKLTERVKIFTGANTDDLEKEYADWYDGIIAQREAVPALKGNPFQIIERSLTIRNYEGEETYALAVFYVDAVLADYEKGKDKGHHLNNGVSMMVGKRRG